MTKINQELLNFIEQKINNYAQRIQTPDQRSDRSALGELEFYIALRSVILFPNSQESAKYDQASLKAHGMLDAVNDTLIKLNLLSKGSKFYDVCFMNECLEKSVIQG